MNFTSETDPDTGRVGNQGACMSQSCGLKVNMATLGFEGLSLDENSQTLWALLQSATVQDGGSDSTTSRYTRLLAFDVTAPLTVRPPIIHEYVVPLPISKKNKTRAASELHFVSDGFLLVLSRDGNGHGDSNDDSSYKSVFTLKVPSLQLS